MRAWLQLVRAVARSARSRRYEPTSMPCAPRSALRRSSCGSRRPRTRRGSQRHRGDRGILPSSRRGDDDKHHHSDDVVRSDQHITVHTTTLSPCLHIDNNILRGPVKVTPMPQNYVLGDPTNPPQATNNQASYVGSSPSSPFPARRPPETDATDKYECSFPRSLTRSAHSGAGLSPKRFASEGPRQMVCAPASSLQRCGQRYSRFSGSDGPSNLGVENAYCGRGTRWHERLEG